MTATKYRQQLMQYWNELLPAILKNQTSWPLKHRTPPPIFQHNFNPDNNNRMAQWAANRFRRPPFVSNIPPPSHTTEEPVYAVIKTHPAEREYVKEDMMGTRNVEYGTVVTAAPSLEDNIQISTAMNVVIIIGALFLIVNVLIFAVLYYKRSRLKMEERNFRRQYEDMQNANLDIDGAGTLREKIPLPSPHAAENAPEGCNVMKMIRQSTKSEDTYEAVKASEESSNQRFKLARNISSSTLDPHTKVRDWIAHEIVQRCSPRFLRRTRQQFAQEHKNKESANKSNKTLNKSTHGANTINTNSTTGNPSTRPASPACKNSSSSSQKPLKISVAIDATKDARSSSVLKQEPIEITKSLESCSSPPPGKMRRSVTLEDFTLDEKPRPVLKRQNSITDIPITKEKLGEEHIIKINHQYSRSDPVDTPMPVMPGPSPPKLTTFDAKNDVNVTSKEDTFPSSTLSPEEALQTIKRRNFPKVLPDFPTDPNYSSMKRRSLPSHNLLNMFPLPENRAATLDQHHTQKLYSRIPPAPPPRISSTLGRKPSNEKTPVCRQMTPVKLADEPPVTSEPKITSNTLHVGPLIPVKVPLKKPEIILNPSQPIYDNLRTNRMDEMPVRPKNTVKTIITADQDHPVKRIEPKVIIKPNTSSIKRDPKGNKAIPRVMVKDTAAEEEAEQIRQASVPPSPTSSIPPCSLPAKTDVTKTESSSTSNNSCHLQSNFSDNSNADSSDSSNSTSTSSDTGTVVKRQ